MGWLLGQRQNRHSCRGASCSASNSCLFGTCQRLQQYPMVLLGTIGIIFLPRLFQTLNSCRQWWEKSLLVGHLHRFSSLNMINGIASWIFDKSGMFSAISTWSSILLLSILILFFLFIEWFNQNYEIKGFSIYFIVFIRVVTNLRHKNSKLFDKMQCLKLNKRNVLFAILNYGIIGII